MTCRVTAVLTMKVQTFINKCLRRLLRVYWPKVVININHDLSIRTGQKLII